MKISAENKAYCKRLADKFYAKYDKKYQQVAGEQQKDIFIVWYVLNDNIIGVYLDSNDELQVYELPDQYSYE